MDTCPTCGRRPRRRTPRTPATFPLLEWEDAQRSGEAAPSPPRQAEAAGAQLVLLHACRDATGEPRAALLLPGRRAPVVYPSITTAIAAKIALEAAR